MSTFPKTMERSRPKVDSSRSFLNSLERSTFHDSASLSREAVPPRTLPTPPTFRGLPKLVSSVLYPATRLLIRWPLVNVVVQHSPMMDFPNKGANFYLPPQDLGAATISKGVSGHFLAFRFSPN